MRRLVGIGLVLAGACGSGNGNETMQIKFQARVGAEPFACTATYAGLGTTATQWTPKDFRFYVSDVRLIGHDGSETALALAEDGVWQREGVALLDFEDKTGSCANGTAGTNAVVTGTAPAEHYAGLKFSLGVPFAQNHQDVTAAPAPLDVSGLFWDWQAGYKFVKIEGSTKGLPGGYNVHVGSTGCDGDKKGNVTTCTNPNRAEISIDGHPDDVTVVADLAALVAGADLDTNAMGTPPGCMSFPGDTDCPAIFTKLGLAYEGSAAGAQAFFRAE